MCQWQGGFWKSPKVKLDALLRCCLPAGDYRTNLALSCLEGWNERSHPFTSNDYPHDFSIILANVLNQASFLSSGKEKDTLERDPISYPHPIGPRELIQR